jgi:hypothetical protein
MDAETTASGTDLACTKLVQAAKKSPKQTAIAAKSSVFERMSFL